MERRFITPKEAISLLKDGDDVHTFRNPNGILIGCDIDRNEIIQALNDNPDKIELGGEVCKSLKHGLILEDNRGYLFIETDSKKLNKFDPIKTKIKL